MKINWRGLLLLVLGVAVLNIVCGMVGIPTEVMYVLSFLWGGVAYHLGIRVVSSET